MSRPTTFRKRFNMRKATWSGDATDVDILVDEVDPTPENYERRVEAIRVTSRIHIPRGVEATTFLVSLKNRKAYMRHTRNST